jgi:hypothetical protein
MSNDTNGVLMNTRHIRRTLLVGVVAALAAVPVAGAANRTVQIDGRLVEPAQVSEAQLAAGHAASTRLVQIGGRFVEPSQVSQWQSGADRSGDTSRTSADSSSGIGAGGIALVAVVGAMALLAASTLLMRRRIPLSRAT